MNQAIENIDSLKSTDQDPEFVFKNSVYYSLIELINDNCKDPLYSMGMYHFSKPGKMVRSSIIFKLGRIYNLDQNILLKWAMSCELLHEASLIHDDLQDGDKTRREQATIWSKFSKAQAVNMGDFLLMLSYLPLEHLPQNLTPLHSKTALKLVQGQASEFELTKNQTLRGPSLNTLYGSCITDTYLDCVRGKTGALFSSLASGVARLSNCKRDEIQFLEQIYLDLGIIFQVQDDLLDLFGDKKRGFQGSDIQEGKCSVLIAKHYDEYPEDKIMIQGILNKPRQDTSVQDIEKIKTLFLDKGTLVLCLEFLENQIADLNKFIKKDANLNFNTSIFNHIQKLIAHILEPINNIYIGSEIDAPNSSQN